MISEGTDIPRLQVCCHMSSVKTELYFRQVLGRILRVNNSSNQQAWLLTFAEENLVGFAERIEQDLPETCKLVNLDKISPAIQNINEPAGGHITCHQSNIDFAANRFFWGNAGMSDNITSQAHEAFTDELRMGRFKERIIAAFC